MQKKLDYRAVGQDARALFAAHREAMVAIAGFFIFLPNWIAGYLAPYGPDAYERYSKWAEEYFWIPHRNVHRGVGGIFYDHLENTSDALFEQNFALTRDVGEAFLDIFPKLVRRRMNQPFTAEEKQAQLRWRGLYAEFNLVYDRGTTFGLKTGGNVDAILMSLPPEVAWD